jgi:N-acetylglutamate synthase-like GNAT family acetyltransferase
VGCGNTFVARNESLGVVGAVTIAPTPTNGVMFLRTMGVEQDLQKRGIGSQLLEGVIEELRKEGVHKVLITLQPSPAEEHGEFFERREFFKKRGFMQFYKDEQKCGMKRDI